MYAFHPTLLLKKEIIKRSLESDGFSNVFIYNLSFQRETQWYNNRLTGIWVRKFGFEPWTRHRVVFVKKKLHPTQCSSSLRSTNGHQLHGNSTNFLWWGVGGLQLAIDQYPYQGVRRTPTPPILHKLWQRPRFHLFS